LTQAGFNLLSVNRSAEHRLGKFPPCLQRAGTVLGAPITQLTAREQVKKE